MVIRTRQGWPWEWNDGGSWGWGEMINHGSNDCGIDYSGNRGGYGDPWCTRRQMSQG